MTVWRIVFDPPDAGANLFCKVGMVELDRAFSIAGGAVEIHCLCCDAA